MQTVSAYRMELQPHDGQSPQDSVAEICTHISDFVVQTFRMERRDVLPLSFDGRITTETGHQLSAARFDTPHHALATLEWDFSLPQEPLFRWRATCVCAADRSGIELQYRFEWGLATLLVSPVTCQQTIHNGLLMPLHLLTSILGRWVATVEGWPVPVAARAVDAAGVDDFVNHVLLNPKRTLPVVLLASRFNLPPDVLQELQCNLLGAAHIAALTSPAATTRLQVLLGAERGLSMGMLRLYQPQFTRESPPSHHALVQDKELPKTGLNRVLHKHVITRSVQQFADGPVACAVRAAVSAELHSRDVQLPALRAQLANADVIIEAFAFERQAVAAERNRLLEQFRAEQDDLRERFRAERDEAKKAQRSAEGKLAEHLHAIRERANELQTARTKLAASEQALVQLRADLQDALATLQGRTGELDEAQQQLALLRDALQAQPTAADSGGGSADEFQRAWQESDHTLTELEAVQQEAAQLRAELAVCKQNLELLASNSTSRRTPNGNTASSAAGPQLPRTVGEALRLASERYADVFEVWDSAWSSAQQACYPSPTRLLEALHAVAELGRDYFAAQSAGQAVGPLEQVFRGRVPCKYAASEGEMTMAMYGHERVFQGPAQRRQVQRHLTLGGGKNCLQVYFDFDDARRVVVIVHCGQRLSHSRQG